MAGVGSHARTGCARDGATAPLTLAHSSAAPRRATCSKTLAAAKPRLRTKLAALAAAKPFVQQNRPRAAKLAALVMALRAHTDAQRFIPSQSLETAPLRFPRIVRKLYAVRTGYVNCDIYAGPIYRMKQISKPFMWFRRQGFGR